MGLVFGSLDTDVGSIEIDYPESDGKGVASFIIGSELEEYAWVRGSGVWLFPITQMSYWQPARRLLRVFEALGAWMATQPLDDFEKEYLAVDVPQVAAALKEAVQKGATEVRLAGEQHDTLERAKSGRSRCRACGEAIEKDAWCFGEDVPSFVELSWHHLACGAEKGRPFLRALRRVGEEIPGLAELEAIAKEALGEEEQASLERARTGRAKCLVCKTAIGKGELRLSTVEQIDETGGPRRVFAHLACAPRLLEGQHGKTPAELVASLREHTAAEAKADWSEVEAAFTRGS